MKKVLFTAAAAAAFLTGCASTGPQTSGSSAQLSECLQPNRRVVVEIGGRSPKPGPKGKPAPKKPAFNNVHLVNYVQGNSAFDVGGATLKSEGKSEIDKLVATLPKKHIMVSSVIVSGHTDRLEAANGNANLSEARAKAVTDYLVTKGIDQKLIFWEGKGAREPVPVTKFCE